MSDAQARRRPRWARLGAELRRLRRQAGLSQQRLHEVLGISKIQVERFETATHGGAPPSVQAVMDWAQACAVAHPDRVLLEALAKAALDEHTPYRDWGSLQEVQEGIRADEAPAVMIRNFNNWGIPGLLQILEYARAVLALADVRGSGDADEALVVRMRRQLILREEGRKFEFLLTEGALTWRPEGVAVSTLRLQLAHLADAVSRPSVEFAVIPARAPTQALPNCPFVLYEHASSEVGPFAAVELPHERVEARAAVDYADYREIFGRLWQSAVSGDEAIAFVHEVARSLL